MTQAQKANKYLLEHLMVFLVHNETALNCWVEYFPRCECFLSFPGRKSINSQHSRPGKKDFSCSVD